MALITGAHFDKGGGGGGQEKSLFQVFMAHNKKGINKINLSKK